MYYFYPSFHSVETTETHCKVWNIEKLILNEKIFCQIKSLVKMLLSRNFCQKYVRENFRNFHTVSVKLRNFSLTHFWQKFREFNVFTKEITKELI